MNRILRRAERGFTAVEVALRRTRVAAGLLLGAAAILQHQRSAPAPTWAGAAALAAALLATAVVSSRVDRTGARHEQLVVALELGVDLVAASAVVLWAGGIGSPAGALLAVPVLHAACRFHTTGALGMWAGAAFVLLCKAIWRWDPGMGIGQLTGTVVPLAVLLALGLTIGYVTDQLALELDRQQDFADRAERRSDLLGVVTTAAADLHTAPATALASVAVQATARLGFAYAALVDRSRPNAPLAATGPFADPTLAVELVVAVPGTTLELYAIGDADEPERAEALDLVVGLLAAAMRRAAERAEAARTAADRPATPDAAPVPARLRWLDAPAPAGIPPMVQAAPAATADNDADEHAAPTAPAGGVRVDAPTAPPRPVRHDRSAPTAVGLEADLTETGDLGTTAPDPQG